MHLTPFGWIFLPIVIVLLLWRRDWLPALLPVAACLHAPAVAIIGSGGANPGYGITPWNITCLALALHMLSATSYAHERYRQLNPQIRKLLAGWTVFMVLGVISAFTLPFLFAGIHTYDNQQMLNLAIGTSGLTWRLDNAAQAANLVILWLMLVYGALMRPTRRIQHTVLMGIIAACAIALLASLVERILILNGVDILQLATDSIATYRHAPTPNKSHWLEWITNSLNPGYRQVVGYVFAQRGIRVGWPFTEPSYASAWFAALTVAGIGVWLFRRSKVGLALIAMGAIGAVNSFSGTGTAALVLCGLAVWSTALVRGLRHPKRRSMLQRVAWLAIATTLALGIALPIANRIHLTHPVDGTRTLTRATVTYIEHKIYDYRRTDHSRTLSNKIAIDVTVRTHGLGVGLGSNRASSFLANLLSNMGIVPSLLFIGLVLYQLRLYWQMCRHDDLFVVLICASFCMAIAVMIGIPDILWPAWWVWLVLVFWMLCWRIDSDQESIAPSQAIKPETQGLPVDAADPETLSRPPSSPGKAPPTQSE